MLFGLSEDIVQQIGVVFSQHPTLDRVLIFGSRAKGTYRNGSDIDLALIAVGGQSLGLDLVNQIDETLEELLLPYTFDLLELSTIENPALTEHIERVGECFYKKDL